MKHQAARRIFQEIEAIEIYADESLPSLEGYQLDRRIGRGAGGDVYRGFRDGSDRALAIKILRIRMGEPQQQSAAARAWRELDLLTQLRLPAVPRVIDHGLHEGRLYIATEFVEGQALDEYCRYNGLGRRERVAVLARVGDAVQSLHERGVIHRDIKPSNILIDTQGQPVIIDLGIASLLVDDALQTLTADGVPIGSPAFMSPEQARGARAELSTRSDVYSLGATAYLVLTGRTPHEMTETIHESVRRVAQDPPRNPRELDPSLPADLAAVLAKSVDRAPERRYVSAAELASDLRAWLRGDPVSARTPDAWRRVSKWAGGHPYLVTTVGSLMIATAIVGSTTAALLWAHTRPDHLEFSGDRRLVRLVSRGDRTLRTWGDEARDALVDARLVARGPTQGGGRALVIGTANATNDPHTNALCLYDLTNYAGQPDWTSAGTIELPGVLRAAAPCDPAQDLFQCVAFRTADVFPELPGQEIVAVERHGRWSPTVIRVYALDGEVLFEVWHDGHIKDVYWMAEAGLLACVGCNSDGTWAERGAPSRNHPFPTVVFAVRPEPRVTRQVLSWPGFTGTMDPAWYWSLAPQRVHDIFGPSDLVLEPPSTRWHAGTHVQLTAYVNQPSSPNFTWILGADGAPRQKSASTTWRQEPSLPTVDEMDLVALPPRLSPRGSVQQVSPSPEN